MTGLTAWVTDRKFGSEASRSRDHGVTDVLSEVPCRAVRAKVEFADRAGRPPKPPAGDMLTTRGSTAYGGHDGPAGQRGLPASDHLRGCAVRGGLAAQRARPDPKWLILRSKVRKGSAAQLASLAGLPEDLQDVDIIGEPVGVAESFLNQQLGLANRRRACPSPRAATLPWPIG